MRFGMRKCERGYFQFENKEDGLYVHVYPPYEGKKAVDVAEAVYYIDNKHISDCDMAQLNDAFKKGAAEEVCVKVSSQKPIPVSEYGDYRMSRDCMTVEVVFYPGFVGASQLSVEEIQKDLASLGVNTGIDEEVIKNFVAKNEYFESFIIAKGKETREGSDGFITYNFNVDLKPTPKMNDDGTVDFHTLENVNHVLKGDVVAVMTPEDKGEAGSDVMGRSVLPRKVRRVLFRYGKNLSISEDGLKLISNVSGHVTLEGEKVFVSNVLELVDVDASTGDINYDGSVMVKGNVLAGFSVKASEDITVAGIVEGATLDAGGNITLNRGVQGMNKAVIRAKGNVVSKFIESALLVEIGGKLETDSILHSKVNAKGSITATGKNGLIVGGEVKSVVLVQAKNFGNAMGTNTVVGVGVDPSAKRRVDELKDNLQKLGANKIQLNQILDALRKKQEQDGALTPDKRELQQKTMRNLIMLEKELADEKAQLEDLRGQLEEDANARIKVNGNMYVGVKMVFGDQSYFVKEKYTFCQFMKEKAEIKCYSM
jgi:hypothetical protein